MWCDVGSDRFWAGLSPDIIIEQVLMRGIKTHGGLTRGKGMTEKCSAFGVGLVHASVHASMRPCKSLAVSLSQ